MKTTIFVTAATIIAAAAFTSCDKGETPTPNYTLQVIDFEDAALDLHGEDALV